MHRLPDIVHNTPFRGPNILGTFLLISSGKALLMYKNQHKEAIQKFQKGVGMTVQNSTQTRIVGMITNSRWSWHPISLRCGYDAYLLQ